MKRHYLRKLTAAPSVQDSHLIPFSLRVYQKKFRPNVGTCLWHVSTAIANVSSRWKHGQRHVATLWRYRFWWFDTSPTPNWWYKVTYFFPHHPKKVYESTSLRIVEISKIRSYRLYFFFISQIGGGEGVKKAAWERGGFQAAAYLDWNSLFR